MERIVLRRHSLSVVSLFTLLALLILPFLAAASLALVMPWYVIPVVMCFFSLWIYFRFASDKKRAQANEWRVPESTLHFYELLGGWPGSYLAQRRFRHKISKGSYQFTFWLIVFAYQIVPFDYLNNFKYSKLVIDFVAKHINA